MQHRQNKRKEKSYLILFVVILLVLLVLAVSCDFDFDQKDKGLPDYRVGYDGLKMTFVDTPEYDLYEKDLFVLQIDLQNKGAYSIDDGIMRITYPPQLIKLRTGDAKRKIPLMQGKSFFNPQGGFVDMPEVFDFEAGKIPGEAAVRATVTANACYHYKSQATLLACVGPRMGPGTCNFNDLNVELNLSQGQGAPLVISHVDESISPIDEETSALTFQIEIANMGKGEVFRYLTSGAKSNIESVCDGNYKFGSQRPINVLNVFDFSIQLSTDYKFNSSSNKTTGNIVCQPRTKPPHLENGRAKIICTITGIKERVAYKAPLIISLDYAYRVWDKASVYIHKPQ